MSNIPTTQSANKVTYPVMKDGAYPARYVKFVGLGLQPQPAFQGKTKGPAFKASVTFELAGKSVIGTKADGTKADPIASCVFLDFFIFPGATRGKAFDFCQALDPTIEAVPKSLDWFMERLDAPCIVTVGHYTNKAGVTRNGVNGVGLPLEGLTVAPSTVTKIAFDPYVANEEVYAKLHKFQQDDLAKALDAKVIPLAGKQPVRSQSDASPAADQPSETTDDDQPF